VSEKERKERGKWRTRWKIISDRQSHSHVLWFDNLVFSFHSLSQSKQNNKMCCSAKQWIKIQHDHDHLVFTENFNYLWNWEHQYGSTYSKPWLISAEIMIKCTALEQYVCKYLGKSVYYAKKYTSVHPVSLA